MKAFHEKMARVYRAEAAKVAPGSKLHVQLTANAEAAERLAQDAVSEEVPAELLEKRREWWRRADEMADARAEEVAR